MSVSINLDAVVHKEIGGGPPPTEFEREQFFYSFFRPFVGRDKFGCWCGELFDSIAERKAHEDGKTCYFGSSGLLDG